MAEGLKPGDPVRVYMRWTRGRGPGSAGVVEKVGRKLVTIRYGNRTDVFRIDTRRINDGYGNGYFRTPEEEALAERKTRALTVLRDHGLSAESRQLTVEQLEALAAVFPDPEEARS